MPVKAPFSPISGFRGNGSARGIHGNPYSMKLRVDSTAGKKDVLFIVRSELVTVDGRPNRSKPEPEIRCLR